AIARGKLVLGGWVTDGQHTGEPSGVVRAFDAVTGKFAWAFDAGKPDFHGMPPAGQSFTRGTPNSWAPMSSDDALGMVYVPTGNATPDYFGGHRTANDDRFSSSVVALDSETGAVRWSFQTTHHDLWDYDLPLTTLVEVK
ncbi:MAG: membrane-bound PQQ-dependent dehydrogenase, glucose/quinate/shikimate family, partial [Pseudomonadota bacterium]